MNGEKQYPAYTGKIQLKDEGHTPAGKISLWNNINPTTEKSPLMTGELQVGDRIYGVSLWKYIPK